MNSNIKLQYSLKNKDYSFIKLNLSNYSKLKEFINSKPNIKHDLFGYLFLNNLNQIEENHKLYNRTTLNQELNWSIIALSSYKKEVLKFIQNEKILFKHILLSNYDECLSILDSIDSDISLSQWSILMRMSILYLKDDLIEMDNFSNQKIEDFGKSDTLHFIRDTIYLHKKKLIYLSDNFGFDKTRQMIYDNLHESMNIRNIEGWVETVAEQDKINQERKAQKLSSMDEVLKEVTYTMFKYSEKHAIAPFNDKFNTSDLSILLFYSASISIIDLYKTFSHVFSELTLENYEFYDVQLKDIRTFSNKINLIKKTKFETINDFEKELDFSTLKIFITMEKFLSGDFSDTVKISINTLKKYPYYIDYIYFLVVSTIYFNKNIEETIKNDFDENSLLYKIIITMHNIFTKKDLDYNLNKMKEILLIFGVQTHWNMFLFHIVKNFICQNNVTIGNSYSKSLIYSYLKNPRFYYQLEKNEKKVVLSYMLKKKQENKSIYKVFLSENSNIDLDNIKPTYRAKYIEALNKNGSLDDLEKLYNNAVHKTPFFNYIKVLVLFVNQLIDSKNYRKSLELIIDNLVNNNIPLCMYNYSELILNEIESIKDMPHYPLLFIFHNKNDYIKNYYALKAYLDSFNNDYSRPSLMIADIKTSDMFFNIKLLLADEVCDSKLLEEFIMQFNCKSDILKEQIKILELIGKLEGSPNQSDKLLSVIDDLIYIKDSHNLNYGRLEIDIEKIKRNFLRIDSNLFFNKIKNKQRWIEDTEMFWEQSRAFYQEDFVQDILIEIIKFMFYSDNGINEQIEGRIKHTFFHEAIKSSLITNHLITKLTNNKKHIPIKLWNNDLIQKVLFNFTDDINKAITDFKDLQLNVEKLESDYYNFSLKNLYSKEDIINITNSIHLENKLFLESLILDVLFRVNIELERYSALLKKSMDEIFISLLKNLDKNTFDSNLQVKLLHDNIQISIKQMEGNIKEITSWIKIKKFSKEEPYNIEGLVNVLKKEFKTLIDYNNITLDNDNYLFVPLTFNNMLYIFHNIFSSIARHSYCPSNKCLINTLDEKERLTIVISSNHCIEKPEKIVKNRGIKVIETSLKIINESNNLECGFNDNNFEYKLSFLKKGFINA